MVNMLIVDSMIIELTDTEVRGRLRRACEDAGSQKLWAEWHGLSQAYVSDVIRGKADPGEGILRALQLERIVRYREVQKQRGRRRK
jgi:hypothetical protein